jgi:hypothetical protein
VVQIRHQQQVLRAGEEVVHRRELAGDPDRGPYPVGVADHVVPADADRARVRANQRGKDLDHRGLAGPVGAEQREDRALGYVQVDAVEHHLPAVRPAQAGHHDRRPGR